ncbi:MAG: serine protease, partial [Planctomycetota bacterium]
TRQPARVASIVESSGKDIYGRPAPNRQILVLAAQLAPGDSGGPVVLPDGSVGGVAFAIDPDRPTTAFALTTKEANAVLGQVTNTPVSTQACTHSERSRGW